MGAVRTAYRQVKQCMAFIRKPCTWGRTKENLGCVTSLPNDWARFSGRSYIVEDHVRPDLLIAQPCQSQKSRRVSSSDLKAPRLRETQPRKSLYLRTYRPCGFWELHRTYQMAHQAQEFQPHRACATYVVFASFNRITNVTALKVHSCSEDAS